jgi:hypothetical protein
VHGLPRPATVSQLSEWSLLLLLRGHPSRRQLPAVSERLDETLEPRPPSLPPPRLPPPLPLASLPEAVPFLPFPMPSPPLALCGDGKDGGGGGKGGGKGGGGGGSHLDSLKRSNPPVSHVTLTTWRRKAWSALETALETALDTALPLSDVPLSLVPSSPRGRSVSPLARAHSVSVASTCARSAGSSCSPSRAITLMREAIRAHQRSSEAIRGHQRPSEVFRGHQRSSEVLTFVSARALVYDLS